MPKAHGYLKVDEKGRYVARLKTPDGKDTRKVLGLSLESLDRRVTDDDEAMRNGVRYVGVITHDRAQEMLDELLAPWRDWTDDSDPTFHQAAIEFLTDCHAKGRRGTTCDEYERIANRLDQIPFGSARLGQYRLSQISEASVQLLREKMSQGCVNQTKTVLAGIVRVARKKHKYAGPDFSEWFERAPVKRKLEIEVYTPAEVEKIASSAQDPEIAAIIRVAAYTGLRMSEIRALTWGGVDFAGEKITVRRRYTDTDGIQPPKNGKARSVPMASQVANALRDHQTREFVVCSDACVPSNGVSGLVFGVGEDGFRSYDWITNGFRRSIEKASLRPLTFHSLRHCFCSTMVQRFPLPTVQEWAGHADIKTTLRYVHHVPKREDAAKISELLSGPNADN